MFWPTGAGKSFTVLRILSRLEHSAVIMLPTLSLMIDYEQELHELGVCCTLLSSLQRDPPNVVTKNCVASKTKVILATPEAVVKYGKLNFFDTFNSKVGIDLVVFEEAHCDYLWDSFRSDFTEAKEIFNRIIDIQRIVISATPPAGNSDLLARMCDLSENYFISKRDLHRDELRISIVTESQCLVEKVINPGEKCIIFCHCIRTVYSLQKRLDDEGFNAFVFTGGSEMNNNRRVDSQKSFQNSSVGVLISTKSQAFGVNYSGVTKVIIYELPDSMEVLYQMIGRASREGSAGSIIIFHNRNILSMHHQHLQQSVREGKFNNNMAELLSESILAMQNLCETYSCRWLKILEYFKCAPCGDFTCKNCDNCESDRFAIDVTNFARPVLAFLSEHSVVRSKLLYIVIGSSSGLNKVDEFTKNKADSHHLIGLGKKVGLTKEKVTQYLDSMINSGLISYCIKSEHGSRIPSLNISDSGRKALLQNKITVHSRSRVPSTSDSSFELSSDECFLPSKEALCQLPFPEKKYQLPQDVGDILHNDCISDDLLEVALQVPVLRGFLTVDFVDKDCFVCVPKQIITSLYCQEHDKIKPNWSHPLTPFHKYPRAITWREGKKWFGANSFVGQRNFTGINFEFTCASAKDFCQAECKWSSLGVFKHGNEDHIKFKVMFKRERIQDTIFTRSHHIHTYTQVPASKIVHDGNSSCCNIDISDLDQQYRMLIKEKTEIAVSYDPANPVRSTMSGNVQSLESDPYSVQCGTTLLTYNNVKHCQMKDRENRRPWLNKVDIKNLSMSQRLIYLKNHIDQTYWEKEKTSGTYSERKKYTYYIESVMENTVGITVLITDLLGIKLYAACADRSVISIDGTGRGSDQKGKIMQYCVTGDVNECFSRSDKTRSGIFSFFEMWLIGKGTTNQPNLESALLTFQSIVLQVTGRKVSPRFVKLDGEKALINACKVLGKDTRRLVEKYHANRKLEYNVCTVGPLKNNGSEQAIFLKMWEKFCDANSMIEAQVIRNEIHERYLHSPGYNSIMSSLSVYFEDPAIVCKYGKCDLPSSIQKKHEGPAESESLFDKLKHHYTDPVFVSSSNVDDILYGNWLVRKRLNVRFLIDWQNAKLPQGVKEVLRKYSNVYGLNFETSRATQKRPRLVKKSADHLSEIPEVVLDEGDMNEPRETYCLSNFNKSKKGRTQARRNLFRKHSKSTSSVLSSLDQAIDNARNSEPKGAYLPQRIPAHECPISVESMEDPTSAEDLILSDSQSQPKFNLWHEIDFFPRKELTKVPLDKMFQIPPESSIFGLICTIMENILCPSDSFIKLKYVAVRYRLLNSSGMFLEAYGCTSSGCRRDKWLPFIFSYITIFAISDENTEMLGFDGLYQVLPRNGKFADDNSFIRLKGGVPDIVRNSLVKSLHKHFPPAVN